MPKAMFPGECPACPIAVRPGDPIAMIGQSWGHERCAPGGDDFDVRPTERVCRGCGLIRKAHLLVDGRCEDCR